jgi:hypothetical protein
MPYFREPSSAWIDGADEAAEIFQKSQERKQDRRDLLDMFEKKYGGKEGGGQGGGIDRLAGGPLELETPQLGSSAPGAGGPFKGMNLGGGTPPFAGMGLGGEGMAGMSGMAGQGMAGLSPEIMAAMGPEALAALLPLLACRAAEATFGRDHPKTNRARFAVNVVWPGWAKRYYMRRMNRWAELIRKHPPIRWAARVAFSLIGWGKPEMKPDGTVG